MLGKTGKLWWLVIVCAFLAGVCAYPMVNQVWYAVSSHTYGSKPMYVGRTTVMERANMPDGLAQKQTSAMQQRRLSNLGNLATSQRVLSNAASTLSSLGMKYTPVQILTATTIEPVRDTNIIAIEVTLPDAPEAKVAADVIADEFKKVYSDMQSAPLSNRRQFHHVWSKNAASTLTAAVNAVKAYKRTHGASTDDAELAKLEADAIAAKDSYVSVKKKLAEAIVEEQRARSSTALATIDHAFVRPLERPNPARLMLTLLFTPLGGPIIGVIVGLVFGLTLAALIRRRRADCPSPQQGV